MANDLRVRVHGDTTSYERAMERAATGTRKYADSLSSLENDLMKLQRQMDKDTADALKKQEEAFKKHREAAAELGKGMLIAGAAIAAGLALAAREAIEWESAWAGVTKVTEGSPAQMAELEGELRNLARTLPATHSEIAAVAEAAGQLGVKRADVAAFTKVMVDMGVSTNLTADEAATSMARFANIMGTPISEVDRLGSAIVALGNDGASTEAEIIEMGLRIAGAGAQIGLTEADVLALANALSSVGIKAEAGGSAVSSVMIKIEEAVRSGGEAVELFGRVAGVSAQQFADQWRRDPAAALVLFEKGLAGVEAQGGDTFGILRELGITEIRQRDAVLRLSGAHEILAASLDTGTRSWQENTALVDEANKRYETTESRIKIAQNQLTDLAITVGEILLPAIGAFAESATGLLSFFSSLPGPVKTAITILAVAASSIALVGGAALAAGPRIAALQAQLATLGGVSGAAAVGLRGVAGVLLGPWGIAIAAGITALTIFGRQHAQNQEHVRALVDSLDEVTGAITGETEALVRLALEQSGALAAADELGLKLTDVADAATGNDRAIQRVNEQLDALSKSAGAAGGPHSQLAVDIEKVRDAIGGENEAITEAVEKQKRLAAANKDTKDTTDETGQSVDKFGDITSDTADEVADLERKVRELRDGLALLNGEALSAEETAIRFREQIRQMKKEVDDHGHSLKANTKAGDANRQMLLNAIEASRNAAEAEFDKTVKTRGHEAAVRAANSTMRENINTLLDEARQLGFNREETNKYIAKILGVPVKSVTKYTAPGLAESLRQARELDGKADDLDGREVNTYFTTYDTRVTRFVRGRQIDLPAAGGPVSDYEPIIPMRRGGVVSGPGGPVDDAAGLFALSNGEYIVNAAATRANRRLLDAINSGGARDTGRLYATGSRGGGWAGMGGITVENLNLTAFSNDFSLSQVRDRLALEGVA